MRGFESLIDYENERRQEKDLPSRDKLHRAQGRGQLSFFHGGMTHMAEGLDCESSFDGFESRISPGGGIMRILGRRRGRKCFVCKQRTAMKNSTICSICISKLKVGGGGN